MTLEYIKIYSSLPCRYPEEYHTTHSNEKFQISKHNIIFSNYLKTHLVNRWKHLTYFIENHHRGITGRGRSKMISLFVGYQSLFLNAVCKCLPRILCMVLSGSLIFSLTPKFVLLLWTRYFWFSVCNIENKSIMTGWPLQR